MPTPTSDLMLTAAGNHASGVSVAAPIELSFSAPILLGTGTITITDGYSQSYMGRDGLIHTRIIGATDTRVLSVSDGQVSCVGNKLVLSLNDYLLTGRSYSVLLSNGAVLDSSEHAFAGLVDTTQFNFGTSATLPVGPTATVNAAISLSNDDGKLSDDGYVGMANQTISGTFSGALGSNIVQVSTDGGDTWHTATVSGSSWSYSSVLDAGEQTIMARVSDGTLFSTERSRSVTLDTQAPTVNPVSGISLDLSAACDAGSSSSDNLTNETMPTIRVNFAAGVGGFRVGDTVELIDSNHGDTVLGYYTIQASDVDWYGQLHDDYVDINVASAHALADGMHALKARIGDLAGHTPTAASAPLEITIDTSAAAVTSATPIDNSTAGPNLAKITLTFDSDIDLNATSSFVLAADDGSDTRDLVSEAGNFHYNSTTHKLSIFIDGSSLHPSTQYTLRSSSGLLDEAGNEIWAADGQVLHFTTTATGAVVATPSISFVDTGISDSDGITSNGEITVGFIAGNTWRYSTDGGTTWHWQLNGEDSFGLDDGSYAAGQVMVQQVSSANQYSVIASNAGTITIDTTAPSATIDYSGIDDFFGTGTPVNVGNIALAGTLAGAEVQYSTDSGATWSSATPNAGHDLWAFSATVAHGGYVGLRVADAAGNQAAGTGISGVSGAHTVFVGDAYGSSDFTTGSGTVLFANDGNDTVSSVSGNFAYLNGGSGSDTLALTGSGQAYDAGAWTGRLQNFEVIDLGGNGNTLKLDSEAIVLALSGGADLYIEGDLSNEVELANNYWTVNLIDSLGGYLTLEHGDATLRLSSSIDIIGSVLGLV